MKNIVFIVSTGGGVLSRLLVHDLVLSNTAVVVSDRSCGAIEVAKRFGVDYEVFRTDSGSEFSDYLVSRFFQADCCFISFYTKLFTDRFVSAFKGQIFNCHPSLLPACKGLKGFEDTLRSNSVFMGSSLHEVDLDTDTGMCLIQCAIPLDRTVDVSINRHKIFLSQYYSVLQFIRWFTSGRLVRHGCWQVAGASFQASPFSPNLDIDFFEFFGIQNEL